MDSIIQKKLLQFVAIDEIHLFVHFAHSFCQEFAWLKPYLFSKLQSRSSALRTIVPVLFMTATCNTTILENVELLACNFMLPTSSGLRHLGCNIDMFHLTFASSCPLAIIQQPCLKKLLSSNATSKYIYIPIAVSRLRVFI